MKKFLILILLLSHFAVESAETAPSRFFSLVYNSWISYPLRSFLCKPFVQACVGHYMNSRLSCVHIKSFIKSYNIDMQETEKQSYRTFNEFFTRKLKSCARPVDQEKNSIVSPCDGTITIIPTITQGSEVLVKGKSFNMTRFLQNEQLANEYDGGTFILIYLSPWNYHRFHFPVDGNATFARRIKGRYESVHPFTYALGIQPLVENERHKIIVNPSGQEPFLFIPVGALFVGAIQETYIATIFYPKGHEMGYFAFGGSTIVMIFKKDTITVREDLVAKSGTATVKMGESIAWFAQN